MFANYFKGLAVSSMISNLKLEGIPVLPENFVQIYLQLHRHTARHNLTDILTF